MPSLKNAAIASAILAAISISLAYPQNQAPAAPSGQPDCPLDVTSSPRSGGTTGSVPVWWSKEVICPPTNVDPGIVNKPPPSNARTPVILPPETPSRRQYGMQFK